MAGWLRLLWGCACWTLEFKIVPIMEIGESSSHGAFGGGSHSPNRLPTSRRRSGAFYQFTQQSLPSCKPAITPGRIIAVFLFTGLILIPAGIVFLHSSQNVVEIVHRYDGDCVPEEYKANKVAYIKDSSIPKNCTREIKVPKFMKAPIFVYYQLDNYYQNHRRYVKSRNDKQLQKGLSHRDTGSCKPEEFSNGLPIVPCGLIAWSLFNDSYSFLRGEVKMDINRKNITWKSDRDHKFGKDVYPFNFQNGSLIGGGMLDPSVPLSYQEDLIVWMRTSALPSFRKLYGRIEENLEADELITVHLVNNYNTYSFGGMKKLVLSTSNWLGGKNNFLGLAYIATGCFSVSIAVFFAFLHVKYPRPYGDPSLLSWNRKDSAN